MSDVFHKQFGALTEDQKTLIAAIKDKAEELYGLYDQAIRKEFQSDGVNASGGVINGREIAVAKTELETSVMWAVKGVTK